MDISDPSYAVRGMRVVIIDHRRGQVTDAVVSEDANEVVPLIGLRGGRVGLIKISARVGCLYNTVADHKGEPATFALVDHPYNRPRPQDWKHGSACLVGMSATQKMCSIDSRDITKTFERLKLNPDLEWRFLVAGDELFCNRTVN